MTGVDAVQSIAGTLYFVTITVVGVRLLLLARRTRQLPELLLGTSLLVGGTLGSVLEAVGMSSVPGVDPSVTGRMMMVGRVFALIGFACQALFIQRVFRRGRAWATLLVAGLLGVMGVAFVLFARAGTFSGEGIDLGVFFLELAARIAFPTWLFIEAHRYAGLMSRRLSLGLADPVVANRFWLWSWMGVLSVVMLLTSVPPIVLDPVADRLWLVTDVLVFGVAGVVLSFLNWLAFFPPMAYRRHLEAQAARGAAANAVA